MLATGELPMSCVECRWSPELRAAWGCDRDTDQPQATLLCPECEGHAPVGNCQTCNGARTLPVYRCPNATIPPEIRDAVHAALVSETGPWPAAGGLMDQSAWFVTARGIVLRSLNEWRDDEMRRAREQR